MSLFNEDANECFVSKMRAVVFVSSTIDSEPTVPSQKNEKKGKGNVIVRATLKFFSYPPANKGRLFGNSRVRYRYKA